MELRGLSCRSEVLWRGQNNRENTRGEEQQAVGGSLNAEHVRARLFVTHSMQRDHTVLLVCGISRLKIDATVGGEKKKGRDSERGACWA